MKDLRKYKFSTKTGFNSVLLKLRYHELKKFFKGSSCLEFGCADGEGTKILLEHFNEVVGVDGSKKLIDKISREIKNPRAKFVLAYFENVQLQRKFDTVLLGHVLEHVDDPLIVLKSAKRFMKKNSIMIIDVPNALSIHRQVGVYIGMIKTEYSLNSADVSIGHQRVYDLKLLRKDAERSGLRVVHEGGLFMKPLSNAQLDALLDEKGIYAFNEVGKKYPEIAGEIFVVCKLND